MNVIKQYSLNPARASLRMEHRSHTVLNIMTLVLEAKSDFRISNVNQDAISVVVYLDRTWGIEFALPEGFIPDGYKQVDQLPLCIV
jgi:hypothetical protein